MQTFLLLPSQEKINYEYIPSKHEGSLNVVYLPGYNSDITGQKAAVTKELCQLYQISYLGLEYRGHGNSSGSFFDYTLSDWLSDTALVTNRITGNTPKILVGSSMGAWLAFLYAQKYPYLVKGIIGIAAALDFVAEVEETMRVGKNPITNENLTYKIENNIVHFYNSRNELIKSFSQKLLADGKNLLLLNKPDLNINCPVRLLHGMKDDVVNYKNSILIAEKATTPDVTVTLLKNGGHRLSEAKEIIMLQNILSGFLKQT